MNKKIINILGFILLAGMSIQSLHVPISASIKPLTPFVAPFVLLVVVYQSKQLIITPLFVIITLFLIFSLVHSGLVISAQYYLQNFPPVRYVSWSHQVFALVIGTSVFYTLRNLLRRIKNDRALHFIIIGSALPLITSIFEIIWSITGYRIARSIVVVIKGISAETSKIVRYRVSGIALEPSHHALYLVLVVLPIIILLLSNAYGNRSQLDRKLLLVTGVISILSLIFTGSSTGYINFGILLICIITLFHVNIRHKIKKRLISSVTILAVGVTVFSRYLFSYGQYSITQISRLLTGPWTPSISSRFYSTFGPILNIESSYTFIGYGLGGAPVYIDDILPPNGSSTIVEVSWSYMPDLKTLIGRVIAETGIIGLILFTLIFITSLTECRTVTNGADESKTITARLATAGLITTFFSLGISYGSFATPYLWFWLAFIDSQYIKYSM